MSEKLAVWNILKRPPKDALRQINYGALKGKSDIDPMWRVKAMTEYYGVCGIGWKFEIKRTWNEPSVKDQVFSFAEVWVYVKNGKEWSEPIPGIGGNTLIKLGKGALLPNDEGYKMAVTDALGTALKMLGVAADVYMGKFDGSKYVDEVQAKAPPRKGVGNPAYNRPPDGVTIDGTPKTAIAEFNDMLAAAGISVNDGNKYKAEVAKDAKIEEWQVLSRALENKNGFCTAIKAWLEERKEWREPGSDDE